MQLKDLMSRDVAPVSPNMRIGEAARRMRDGDFAMMPVGENRVMIGTISDRDIAVRAVAEGRSADTQVREVMSQCVDLAYEDDSIEHALKLMSAGQVRSLPVLDRNGRLAGVVALHDLTAYLQTVPVEPQPEPGDAGNHLIDTRETIVCENAQTAGPSPGNTLAGETPAVHSRGEQIRV